MFEAKLSTGYLEKLENGKKYPYLIGDFMWTAWDYLGEAGIGAWSYTGGYAV